MTMANAEAFDAIIIGGGPAGLAAGIALARHQLKVLLLEKHGLPRDKPCGEGIMPTGVALLDQLGVTNHLNNAELRPFQGISYFGPDGNMARADFREGVGLGIRRLELSRALYARACEIPDLEVRTRCTARLMDSDNMQVSVAVANRIAIAPLVIVADGLHSPIRRQLQLQERPGSYERWGARQHFEIPPWSSDVEVYFSDGLEAYVTPSGPCRVGVAFLWHRDRIKIKGGQALIPELLAQFPELERRLQECATSSSMAAIGPLQQRVVRRIRDGVVFLGDAGGYLDAITGEGISLALEGALCLEKTVVPVLKRHRTRPGEVVKVSELRQFERKTARSLRRYYRLTGIVLKLSCRPNWSRRVVRALHDNPVVFQHLLSANMGLVAPWRLSPTALWRFGWSLIWG
ncbi:MAG: FAD-dependent monooxygenase [Leptospiraceae bacterium]|nr:FAD-dependent monooxygenase [Leptospiraceae bacterium]